MINKSDEELLVELRPKGFVFTREWGQGMNNFFCTERKITLSRIAKSLKVSRQAIHQWFKGKGNIPIERMVELNELKDRIIKWEEINGKKWGYLE